MQGKATIAKHPIHPMLVTVPIGCFVASLISDIVSWSQGPAFWATMGTWLVGFGVAAALVAAFFGFVDYLTAPMSAQAKSAVAWHMMLMIGVVVVYGTSFALRYGEPASAAGYFLSWLGFTILVVAGVMGGSVAHVHLVGSSENDLGVARQSEEAASHGIAYGSVRREPARSAGASRRGSV